MSENKTAVLIFQLQNKGIFYLHKNAHHLSYVNSDHEKYSRSNASTTNKSYVWRKSSQMFLNFTLFLQNSTDLQEDFRV